MIRHAQSERLQLCDELDRLGPDKPTMCEGWETRDLAAHLVVREHRPDLSAGRYITFLRGHLEREQRAMALGDYPALVSRIRTGPPVWNPMRNARIDELTNLLEFYIHFEDVRRAQPEWQPRDLPADRRAALWTGLRRSARLMFRRVPTGIVLIAEGQGRYAAKLPDVHGTVILRGRPEELLLYSSGRTTVAEVELEGDADDIAALQGVHLGIS